MRRDEALMGLFITFEGIEGSGKTTQIKALSKHLNSSGIRHVLTREPGGTPFADRLRKLILIPEYGNMQPFAELCIMLAARADHVAKLIRKSLDKGRHVICDRFTDATLAYQGGGRKIDEKMIRKLNDLATSNIRPDLTILLDLPAAKGLERSKKRLSKIKLKNRESRFEEEKLKFHRDVRKVYLKLAQREKKRIKVIDATLDRSTIQEKIRSIVLNEIKRNKRTGKGRKRT